MHSDQQMCLCTKNLIIQKGIGKLTTSYVCDLTLFYYVVNDNVIVLQIHLSVSF